MDLDTLAAIAFGLQEQATRQARRTTSFLNELKAQQASAEDGKSFANFTDASCLIANPGSEEERTVPFAAPWCRYRCSFQIGTSECKDEMEVAPRLLSAWAIVVRAIETDLCIGRSLDRDKNPTLSGVFSSALTADTHMGLSCSNYPEWASTVLDNSGIPRRLSGDLIQNGETGVFLRTSETSSGILLASGAIGRVYRKLFRLETMNDELYGGQDEVCFYGNKRIVRSAIVPSGMLALVNLDHVGLKFLPQDEDSALSSTVKKERIRATDIPMRVGLPPRKEGQAVTVSVSAVVAGGVLRRNVHALIKDIDESCDSCHVVQS